MTDARKAWSKKSAIQKKKERERRMQQAKEWRQHNLEKATAAAQEASKDEIDKLNKRLAAARNKARDKASAANLSRKRRKRAQVAEGSLKQLQAALEEEESEDEESEGEEEATARCGNRRDERGRFKPLPNRIRVLIWAQLSRRVPPSAINANISDAIGALASEEQCPLPCERELQKMRGELTIASEAIAAFRVALSKRVVSLGWDESSKFGLGLLSSNTQIETQDGQVVDVVMRGATLTAGGTAEAISWAVDRKIFAHARRLLTEWKAAHEKLYMAQVAGRQQADRSQSPLGCIGCRRRRC